MKCPLCKTFELEQSEIEPNLFADICSNCLGKWISSENYSEWLVHHGDILPEIRANQDPNMEIPEFSLARVCPRDRRILIKYKVGRNLPFRIDRCGTCAGVWLDYDEWKILKSRNLHDEMNRIFTDHWQEEVKREETRKTLEEIYSNKFGKDDYATIKAFKKWMTDHEKSGEILAFIRDKNPLQF